MQASPRILYYCPDVATKSAGIRILYRHIEILVKHGFDAAIVHEADGFRLDDVPDVPIRYAPHPDAVRPGDAVVVPEGYPLVMRNLTPLPVRRVMIALNWRSIYQYLDNGDDWRTLKVDCVLTQSPFIGDFVAWAMGLPTYAFIWAINPTLYYEAAAEKAAQISFITRKQGELPELRRVLWSRNRDFVNRIAWVGLDGLNEAEYARQIRRSLIFLNLSPAEGLPCSLLEAMRAGTIVAGHNSVGGQRELIGGGEKQNCILADNMDYIALAQRLEPLLLDILAGNLGRWSRLRHNALATSLAYTPEAEEASVLAIWKRILG